MEVYVKQQSSILAALNKSLVNFKKDPAARKTQSYFKLKLNTIREYYADYKENHKNMVALCVSDNKVSKHDYFTSDHYSVFEESYIGIYAEIEEKFREAIPENFIPSSPAANSSHMHNSVIQTNQSAASNNNEIKLPPISLPKFEGNYQTWTSFHDLFNSLIHSNNALSSVQKLHYLKTHLIGEAEQLLRHFSIQEANYIPAWALLKERFENKRVLVNSQLKRLLNIPIMSQDTATNVCKLLDATNECLQALKNLGIDTDSWDAIIIYLTVQKLPTETHQLWEQSLGDEKDLPSFAKLKAFLETRFRTLEAIHAMKPKQSREMQHSKAKEHTKSQSYHVEAKNQCRLCSESHHIRNCPNFLKMNSEKKNEVARSKGLCINCLGHGHFVSNCPSNKMCFHCKKKHHTFLHLKTNNQSASSSNTIIDPVTPDAVHSFHTTSGTNVKHVLLATALIRIQSSAGDFKTVRALLDQGSQASFISESAVQLLKLKKSAAISYISGLGKGNTGVSKARVQLKIMSIYDNETVIDMEALVHHKKNLTDLLPSEAFRIENCQHFKGLRLADPNLNTPGNVDVLLGADVYAQIIRDGIRRGKRNQPVAQNTAFGWIISGELKSATVERSTTKILSFHNHIELNQELKQFWELEELPTKPILTDEEEKCENIYKESVERDLSGKYTVRLPFKTYPESPVLGKSREAAVSRLLQMEKRLMRNENLHRQYVECMEEYLTLGHMVRIPDNQITKNKYYYLPHHAVIKESSTTTKVRVVFDASQVTSSGKSLNDMMLTGPTLQEDLRAILCRWRLHKIAFMADIEKMYRQINVHTDDITYQRIVWRTKSTHPINDYWLRTVTFGTSSAPYLAVRTLQQLARDEGHRFPHAAKVTLRDFYVDDILSGADNVEAAKELQAQLLNLLEAGQFNLRKWVSNHSAILETINADQREICLPMAGQCTKALGIKWNPKEDEFLFSINMPSDLKMSKRSILSTISKLYDPLGWIAPVVVYAKIFLQKLWLQSIDWDDTLSDDLIKTWQEYYSQLKSVEDIRIPRWLKGGAMQKSCEIHGFCDSSIMAYAAVAYLKITDENGSSYVNMIMSKTKVAPIKQISLPRLELCGAVLLAKLIKSIKEIMYLNQEVKTYAWTDSTIVLAWLQSHPSRWKTFIGNRVSEIHAVLGKNVWRHVSSKDNPADCASRGLNPIELKKHSLWWSGPKWLKNTEDTWPTNPIPAETTIERRLAVHFTHEQREFNIIFKFSKLTKLLRTSSYVFRFINKCKKIHTEPFSEQLTVEEINHSLQYWIKWTQKLHYPEDWKNLNSGKTVPRKSNLLNLSPFIGNDGLIRVGGRLRNADVPYNEKHQIILPKNAHFTRLLIDKTHIDTLHGGTQLMLNVLRTQYWIINARNSIRHQIHKCIVCHRHKKQTESQLMGDLPEARVNVSRPFSHTGIDYCGPISIRVSHGRSNKIFKGYIAVFVCLTVKAIHLEAVSSLSTDAFLAAFRRFVARRGLCSDIYTDGGSNFVGAERKLKSEFQQAIQQQTKEVAETFITKGIKWHFIPPGAPHFGGLWEAGVKSTKHHLRRILGNSILTFEELSTTLTQIEACLNSRPLYPITNDPLDTSVLTPGHFLTGNALLASPEPSLLDLKTHRLSRWQLVQKLVQTFWDKWSREYLSRLQQKPKWLKQKRNVSVGDIVLIKDERLPPSKWLIARVQETHLGADGIVRVVTLRTPNNVLKRPITKISVLPVND